MIMNDTPQDEKRLQSRSVDERIQYRQAWEQVPPKANQILIVKVGSRMVNNMHSFSMDFFVQVAELWLGDGMQILIVERVIT